MQIDYINLLKDRASQTGLKHKIELCFIYKRCTQNGIKKNGKKTTIQNIQ